MESNSSLYYLLTVLFTWFREEDRALNRRSTGGQGTKPACGRDGGSSAGRKSGRKSRSESRSLSAGLVAIWLNIKAKPAR